MAEDLESPLTRLDSAIGTAGRRLSPSLLAETAELLDQLISAAPALSQDARRRLALRVQSLSATLGRAETMQRQASAIESTWADCLFGATPGQRYPTQNTTPLAPSRRLRLEA